ncbi:hypothetical protein Ait01nite_080030 [Actinoplanes italicus]|nr:hypothetical protein Ait01nite_080030 [Actinoplanes italicus]
MLARLAGFGMVLVPHWPYAFERDGDDIRVTRWTPSGPLHAVLQPGREVDGGEVFDVADGPELPYWTIETSVFRTRWPAGFVLESPSDESDATPFYLLGPGTSMIFTQGPVPRGRLAGPGALVAPGQTVLRRSTIGEGAEAVELGYRHEGEQWWQCHWTIPYRGDRTVVVTAQAPEAGWEQAAEAAEAVVTSFEDMHPQQARSPGGATA